MSTSTSSNNGNADRLARHQRLVDALLHDAGAMPVPRAERRLLQTAISSLIVARDDVFKLRKPLRLGFLDFSTAALRRADCEEELRLNRRTAPALYLNLLPISGSEHAPCVGGAPQDAIDWVVHMRRFDDTQQLDELADRGELSAVLVDALADTLADFHGALPPSPASFGLPATVRHWALENFDALQAGSAAQSHAQRLRKLRTWTEAAFARIAPLLAERHATGWVREGHGDLHLGNLVLLDGKPVPFDALEFNPSLRHIDVMADLAFTFMDLRRHGLHAWAWRLVNRYTERSGDHGGLATLRFFAVYRAMVRAKVALLRAEQHDAKAQAAFERDLRLAEVMADEQASPSRLVLTSGVSGSGKSSLAQMLAESIGAIRLRSDVERKRLFGMAARARPDAAQSALLYSAETTARTYARLASLAATLLDAGLSVIADATFLRRDERDRMRAVAAAQGACATLIECHASEPVLRARVRHRLEAGDDASDADLDVLAMQLARREAVASDEQPCRIDTEAALDDTRAAALRCIA